MQLISFNDCLVRLRMLLSHYNDSDQDKAKYIFFLSLEV